MELKITKAEMADVPEYIQELVNAIRPLIDAGTRFVLKQPDPNLGKFAHDDELRVTLCNAEAVKNLAFHTDGTYTDSNGRPYKDGVVKNRKVVNYNYVVIENAVFGQNGESRLVKTCYVRDKRLLFELRKSVGLHGW